MKLQTILLIAVHGAQASHKVTTNAVEAETTHRLAAEAAAGVVKMPGAVARLFGRAEGAEVPAKQAQGPVEQHQDHFKAGHAPGKVDIYYLGVEGPPADFVLVDTKSGVEHRIPIEAGTHITYDNAVYEHRVDANPDSKRTMLGPASLPSGGRRLEAVGGGVDCPNFDPDFTYSCPSASGGTYTCNRFEYIGTDGDSCAVESCCTSDDDCAGWGGGGAECVPCGGRRRSLRSPLFGSLGITGYCKCKNIWNNYDDCK